MRDREQVWAKSFRCKAPRTREQVWVERERVCILAHLALRGADYTCSRTPYLLTSAVPRAGSGWKAHSRAAPDTPDVRPAPLSPAPEETAADARAPLPEYLTAAQVGA